MRRAKLGRAFVVALGVSGAWGCAAKEAAAPEPRMDRGSSEPATIEEAQAQLERARVELGVSPVGTGAGATPSTSPRADATTESTTGAPSPAPVAKQEARCGGACRAIASMRRAVDAICRIAGVQDARCTDAKTTLKDSETRVAGCGC